MARITRIRARLPGDNAAADLVHGLAKHLRSVGSPDLVFIWVPKTAGTSLWKALDPHRRHLYLSAGPAARRFPNRGLCSFGHMSWNHVVTQGIVRRRYADRAHVFSVVRNPFDRAVSLHRYLDRHRVIDRMSFDAFIDHIAAADIPRPGLFIQSGLSQARPMADWLTDDEGNLIVDTALRFERLQADFSSRIIDRFGFASTELPRVNASRSELDDGYRRYYASRRTRTAVEELYRVDLELFSYGF